MFSNQLSAGPSHRWQKAEVVCMMGKDVSAISDAPSRLLQIDFAYFALSFGIGQMGG